MPVITLLTDFGLRDGYVGVMKGVIWKICPEAQIADITHFIPPQNIRQGAVALLRTVKYFPKGTVHIAVVDPGVGTSRKPLAAEVDGHFFVGPDNGLFSLIFQEAEARGSPAGTFHLIIRNTGCPRSAACFMVAISLLPPALIWPVEFHWKKWELRYWIR